MKSYTASQPTWEEKNAQIASRLQNSILTQNLSVKSAQNFMEKFVHKQGTKNGPSPSSLIEPSSYYAAPISSDTLEPADSDSSAVTSTSTTDSPEVQSTSSIMAKPPIKTKVVGKVLASPISSGSSVAATPTKIPRGVVTATPVTTQTTPVAAATSTQQQQASAQQQGAINPTAINLANALKALAAAQSRAQQQQLQKKIGTNSGTPAAAVVLSEKLAASTSGITNKDLVAVPTPPVTTNMRVSDMDNIVSVTVSGPKNDPEALKSEESATPSQAAALAQTSVTTPTQQQPTSSTSSVQEPADSTLNEAAKPQVSLNAILGTNLSPEAERLLSALISSLQPSQVSSSSTSGQTASVTAPAVAQSLPTTSAISSSALSFCSTMSSEQSQGAPQYAPFPSSGTRTTTEQLVGNTTDDHFIDHEDDTSQLLQATALVDDSPLSASTDLGALCDLGSFPSTSDNKRPLELSDSLFTGSSIKRSHMDDTTEF